MKQGRVDSIIGNKEKLESSTYKTIRESNKPVNLVGDIFENEQAISPIISKVKNRIRGLYKYKMDVIIGVHFVLFHMDEKFKKCGSKNIIKQIKLLLEKNYKEIVLTGVDLKATVVILRKKFHCQS